MSKKHIFLRFFSKITTFACVFCTLSAWAETTTCDINYTPVTGNSIQNGNPTPENPVTIESVGTKVGNKYQISVTAQGKNLFDKVAASTEIITGYIGNNGIGSSTRIISGTSERILIFKCNPNTTYTITKILSDRLRVAEFPSKPVISSSNITNSKLLSTDATEAGRKKTTVTTDANGEWLAIQISNLTLGTGTNPTLQEVLDTMQIEEGSTATSYVPYGHSTTPIYLNAPLRKVGDYADVLDYKNGTITRNVGVKVLDGTENWTYRNTQSGYATFQLSSPVQYNLTGIPHIICSHFADKGPVDGISAAYQMGVGIALFKSAEYPTGKNLYLNIPTSVATDITTFKQYLADQYANGTPVTVYYPLATPVVEQIENWSCTPPITEIKIATTKFVDEEFAAAEANLAATVQTIESVVSRTIAQTGQIQILQDTKQTRPDESCPANMKCLLVQDEDGTPHWYPIIEP